MTAVCVKFVHLACLASMLGASSRPAIAQDLLDYRNYSLGTSIESVLELSGARATDVKTPYDRPVVIKELEWRPPYARSSNQSADPVRLIVFSFYDSALYQVLVSYDASRTDGLSNGDVIGALTEAYGIPVPASARRRPLEATADTIVLAQWDRAGSSLTLLRRVYQPDFELLLTSKVLAARARDAIRAAEARDMADAPRRDREQRKTNKGAFRP